MVDGRSGNGGVRSGAGRKAKDEEGLRVPIAAYVTKSTHRKMQARKGELTWGQLLDKVFKRMK